MLTKSECLKQFQECSQITESGLYRQYRNGEINHQFFSGDEMAYRANVLHNEVRKIVVFNRVKPFVNSVAGFMIKLRRKVDYQARQEKKETQQLYTEELNGLSEYLRSDANLDQIESRQDKEMLITGVGAVDTSTSYLENPFGTIKGESLKYDRVGWDPEARETNLTDARWVYRREVMNRDDAQKMFGGDESEFEDAQSPLVQRSIRDRHFYNVGSKDDEDLVQIYYYQWFELEDYYRIDNPLYDESIPMLFRQEIGQAMTAIQQQITDDKETDAYDKDVIEDLFQFNPEARVLVVTPKTRGVLNEIFAQYNVEPDEIKAKRKCYYTGILSGDKCYKIFKSPDQRGFTIKFKTGDYDEVNGLWYGMVDQLREPSRYANKALTEILYVIASNSKGGVMYEESATNNPQKFEQQYASTKSAVMVADGALSGGKIAPKAQAALPTGFENVLEYSKQGLFETTGINPEFLGSSENKQVSALLEAQRIEQVVSTLATYFDSITLYQKLHGELMLTFMRVLAENNPDLLYKVLGDDGAVLYQKVNRNALNSEFDVTVQELPTTPVQKREDLNLMLRMAQEMAMVGINLYPAIIDMLPVPQSKKQMIRQAVEGNPPSPQELQQQAMMQQMQMRKEQAEVAKTEAEAAKTGALAQKHGAEIGKTLAETDKTKAETTESLLEAEQTELENQRIALTKLDNINLTI